MSTETVESVGTATFTDIVEQMDFHLECELPEHETDEVHEGDAAWHAHLHCPDCGYETRIFTCDKYKSALTNGGIDCMEHMACGSSTPAKEWHDAQTWIKI